jgi:PilX N-terminal
MRIQLTPGLETQPPMTAFGYKGRRRQGGVALFIGLVFLIMLTLIALVMMRGTMLEMRLTTATARHEQAFEASEALRAIPEALLPDHVFNRGWPQSWGGNVPDSLFDLPTTFAHRTDWIALLKPASGAGIQDACGGTGLVIFYLPSTCSTHTASYNYTPTSWDSTTVFKNVCIGGAQSGCSAANEASGTISIVRDGVTPNSGSGGAQAQGYSSPGVGTATGGAALLLQVRSDAKVAGNGEAVTIAQYKQNITH